MLDGRGDGCIVYNCNNKSVVKSDRVIQCMMEGLRRVRMVGHNNLRGLNLFGVVGYA